MENTILGTVRAGARRVKAWYRAPSGDGSISERSNWVDDVLARYVSADTRSIVW